MCGMQESAGSFLSGGETEAWRAKRAPEDDPEDEDTEDDLEDDDDVEDELSAAEDDDLSVGLCCFARKAKRVSDKIGDVLHLGPFVVVREDDGVTFAGDAANLVVQLGESWLRLNGHA